MNATTLAQLQAMASADSAEEVGRSFIIQIEPDLTAGERINVGVAVVQANGQRLVKVLTDFARLEYLYGKNVSELVRYLVRLARAGAESGAPLVSPNVIFTPLQPFYNLDAKQYLEQFFARVVPAGAVRQEAQINEKSRNTKVLWRETAEIIKLRVPDHAESILPSTPFTQVMTPRGMRDICVPLTPWGAAGALESADFSGPTIGNKLMSAMLDIETAAAAKNLPRLGLFIARPKRARTQAQLHAIDSAIDYVASRAPANCRVEVESSVETLAEHILDWAQLKAA